MQRKILITGANGQIETELTAKLVQIYGKESVIASDLYIKRRVTLQKALNLMYPIFKQ